MMNGCLCCVLVGQMKNALLELRDKYAPDRVIVETSGSAFPGPVAWQLREMADEGFTLDAILTVVDCLHFTGYEDTSYTAKMQAQYSDVILLNKHEQADEEQMDRVIDRINDLNDETPRVRVSAEEGPDPDVVFGLDTRLFLEGQGEEVLLDPRHHDREIDVLHLEAPWAPGETGPTPLDQSCIEKALKAMGTEEIYRVKGFFWSVPFSSGPSGQGPQLTLLNTAFGRSAFSPLMEQGELEACRMQGMSVRVTVMGIDLAMYVTRLRELFGIHEASGVHLHRRGSSGHDH